MGPSIVDGPHGFFLIFLFCFIKNNLYYLKIIFCIYKNCLLLFFFIFDVKNCLLYIKKLCKFYVNYSFEIHNNYTIYIL